MLTVQVCKICVVYAIRQSDGIDNFKRFIESCKKYSMSLLSDTKLVVAVKESSIEFEDQIMEYAAEIGQDISLKRVPNGGFAFGSWLSILQHEESDICVLLTASSEATRNYWVDSLTQGFNNPNVGIVASMCSSESIRDTYLFAQLLRVKLFLGIRLSNYESDISEIFNFKTRQKVDADLSNYRSNFLLNFLSLQIRNVVLFFSRNRGDWSWKRTFPKSPNTHFRTTGFAIRSGTYFQIMKVLPTNSAENLALETGHDSFTRQVEKLGLEIKIFSSTDGLVDLESQSANQTFRWIGGDSIVIDAHSREFASLSLRRQLSLQRLSHC